MQDAAVFNGWVVSYPDPIELRQGEQVVLTGREDLWDGHRWLWAINAAGKEGWVPDTMVRGGVALRNYTAMELTCQPGQRLTVLDRTHGWTFCRDAKGMEGWVPDSHLDTG